MASDLIACAECPPGNCHRRIDCKVVDISGREGYLCQHHTIRYKCDECGRVEFTPECRATHKCTDCAGDSCASCHRWFPSPSLVVYNEATGTHLCRNCDAYWSCPKCGRTYLNDAAIETTGMCSGCASDALEGGE